MILDLSLNFLRDSDLSQDTGGETLYRTVKYVLLGQEKGTGSGGGTGESLRYRVGRVDLSAPSAAAVGRVCSVCLCALCGAGVGVCVGVGGVCGVVWRSGCGCWPVRCCRCKLQGSVAQAGREREREGEGGEGGDGR